MPWFQSLYRERMRISDGRVAMPEGNGLGFTFDPEAVDRLRIK
jgi:L-alanine-DL-glutamate epimerase-like enolase superfamily enzyme